jgi:signal peptidase II
MKKQDLLWKLAYLAAAFGVFMLDQASKAWVRKTLRFGDEYTVFPNFLNFIYAENNGIAFSQLQNGGDFGRWGLAALAALAACAVMYYFWRTPKSEDKILGACALLLAGIIGNLTDRVRLGYVIDFIDVQFGNWHYPTFNVADSAICLGAFLVIISLLFGKKSERQTAESQQNLQTESPKQG